MKATKLITAFACILVSQAVFAQEQTVKSQKSTKETTVEDEYMGGSAESALISELAASDDYDNKQLALSYLADAVDGGRTSPEIVASLSGLAGEGVRTQARTNGRITNNFPDVRASACDLLGKVQTEEAKNTLVSIAVEDKEPMVVTAAIRSLGNIGINDNDEVVSMIEFVHRKYAVLNPTSSLALEVLNAYEKLEGSVQDKNAMVASIVAIRSNTRYAKSVRDKAQQLLNSIQQGGSKKKDSE